ncbi:MAG: hypothetical protein L6Q98_11910 [Anaerolineae bacterium]|nr:hypothetical protein [Anaerolineae bacterium]NUQ06588.1 hypothetical protein [Anaerolineae bacterium]
MLKTTALDTDYATVWYYPESKIVHHVFHRFIHGEPFRDVLETGLRIFEENGANKWLSDDRKNSALPTEDMAWSTQDWSPRCLSAGWKYWAILMPDKRAGQLNMDRIAKQLIDQGLVVRVFEHTDEALAWLKSV